MRYGVKISGREGELAEKVKNRENVGFGGVLDFWFGCSTVLPVNTTTVSITVLWITISRSIILRIINYASNCS